MRVKTLLTKWPSLEGNNFVSYIIRDIYNEDEFGLFYTALPIISITDNCTTLSNIENLKSITLCTRQPNTASSLQPKDNETHIIQKIIRAIDNGKQKI